MRVTINDIKAMKGKGQRIPMVTAYDYPTAKLVDEAGMPFILVGDSLGQVVLGYESTVRVTMEEMLHHIKAVVRGAQRALVVADMPFMSYQSDVAAAIRNAGRMLQEGGAGAVKLEGGEHMAETVRRIVECGIPVMGHIGLTPQSVHQLGGYKVQGRTPRAAAKLVRDAHALEEAGAFSIVLESVPTQLSRIITQRLAIPTIGIGAGPFCDGQVQVLHDMMGMFTDFVPKHARRYANLGEVFKEATAQYIKEVQEGAFPTEKESFTMDESVLAELEGVRD
ncbi:MAG: 3-methyl-2-oxobutanoate hydroxymethyltransferase [Chloroflexi bacterium]|nr:3-methyl-2-oxobutanoate hydroxymethyltransferase [Chloroflexota bacterium]